MFERFPRDLKQQALRIHELGFARGQAEELGIRIRRCLPGTPRAG